MMTKHKSFTLIELLVVIVIIGILSGIIMISTSSSIDKASLAKSKVFSENIRNRMLLNLKMEFQFDSILPHIQQMIVGATKMQTYTITLV